MATPSNTGTTSQQDQNVASHTRSDTGRGAARGRGIRSGRGYRGNRGSRGITASSQSRTTGAQPTINHPGEQGQLATSAAPASLATVTLSATAKENKEDNATEAEVCFICASDVIYQCLTPCNHRTCHICGLRMRALYKNNDCAHCRVCIIPIG